MGNFIEYNRHPQQKRVGDCVVRAISTAFNKDYLETRKDLLKEAKALKFKHYSDHDFLAKYMSKCGFRKISFPAVKGEERMKLCEFANEFDKGTYITSLSGHAVAVVDGCALDIWDSTYLTVYTAWEVKPSTHLKDLGLSKADSVTKYKRIYQ